MRGAPVAYGQPKSYGSALLWGGLVGVLALLVVVLAVFFGIGSTGYQPDGVPTEILMICAVQDSEGATVAGIVVVMDPLGGIEVVDPLLETTIPGTSYETLQDAFPFGGGAAVADAYSDTFGGPIPAWAVLPQESWESILNATGGVEFEVEGAVNAYVADELVSIAEGTQTLSGSDLSALWASAPFAATPGAQRRTSEGVSQAVGEALSDNWPAVVDEILEGDGSSPVLPDDLRGFRGVPGR